MNWISAEELLLLHARVLEATGGLCGVTNPGLLSSDVHRTFSRFGGQALYPGLGGKVAAMVHAMRAK